MPSRFRDLLGDELGGTVRVRMPRLTQRMPSAQLAESVLGGTNPTSLPSIRLLSTLLRPEMPDAPSILIPNADTLAVDAFCASYSWAWP